MTRFEVSIPCVPPTTTHQRKKIGRGGAGFGKLVDTPELEAAKSTLDALLLTHRPPGGDVLVPGVVELRLIYTWPWLKSHTKRERAVGWMYRDTKPDCSNLAKTIEDRLVAMRYIDADQNVAKVTAEKRHGDHPGIQITILSLAGHIPF